MIFRVKIFYIIESIEWVISQEGRYIAKNIKEIYKEPQQLLQKHHYCSRKCFSSHYRKGQFVSCAICGKKYWMENWQLKRSKKYYCSRECWQKRDMSEISQKISITLSGRKIKGEFKMCSYCGKEIWKSNCNIRKKNFCSIKCRGLFRREDKEIAKKISMALSKKVLVECSYCGKKILMSPCRLRKAKNLFCSPQCNGKFYRGNKERAEKIRKRLKGVPRPWMSNRMSKLWKDDKYVQKQMKARHLLPNKTELFLDNILNNLLPSEYKELD